MPPRSEDASESKELLTPCRKCGRSEDLILGHSHFFELRFGVSVRVVRNCALTNNISSRLNNNCEVLLYTILTKLFARNPQNWDWIWC